MAKKVQRKTLDVDANLYADFDDFDGKTPEQIIENMQAFRAEYPERDLYFHINHYGYDGGKEMTIRERRLETEKEFQKRIAEEQRVKAKEKETKATKEAKEFLEYQRLQKKFQGKSGFQ
jgi:hypothetical protein